MDHVSRLHIIGGMVAAFVVGSALAQPLPDPAVTREMAQGRELQSYERGGDFDASEPIDSSRHHGKIPRVAALRKFIWEHWRTKRRGYVTLSESGIDAGWTSHIFIEPTDKGDWHIIWRVISRTMNPPPEGSTPYPDTVSEKPEITSVDRAQRKRGDAPGGSYVLVFRGKDGKEITRL
jgi:hypothetical protein